MWYSASFLVWGSSDRSLEKHQAYRIPMAGLMEGCGIGILLGENLLGENTFMWLHDLVNIVMNVSSRHSSSRWCHVCVESEQV